MIENRLGPDGEYQTKIDKLTYENSELFRAKCKCEEELAVKDAKIKELDWLLGIINKYTLPGTYDTQDSIHKVLAEQCKRISELEHYIKIKELG